MLSEFPGSLAIGDVMWPLPLPLDVSAFATGGCGRAVLTSVEP